MIPSQSEHAIELDRPIVRGEQTVPTITLRRPNAGELRGLSLIALIQMDIDALSSLLPRISTPTIQKPEVLAMDPADLLECGIAVAGFFQRKGETLASRGE